MDMYSNDNTVGVTTNCIMYLLIRSALDNTTKQLDDTQKSLIITNSINKSLASIS